MKARNYVAMMAAIVVMMTIVAPLRASFASSASDAAIVSSIKDTYVYKTYLKDDDIKIASRNGVVKLTGVVAEGFHKSLAAETAEGVNGVKSVDNRLTVKGAEPTANSDAWIKEKVKATLLFHRSTSGSGIEVSVLDGKVTLSGKANSQAQKELATEYAGDIDGVKSVDNNMVVSPAETTTGKAVEYIDDASITAQVKYALLTHRSTSAIHTKVSTKSGVVTVSGEAKNEAEAKLVTKLVNDINGVTSVNNLMTVQ